MCTRPSWGLSPLRSSPAALMCPSPSSKTPCEDCACVPARRRVLAEIALARGLGDVLLDLRFPIHRDDVSELEIVPGLPPVCLGGKPHIADLAGEAHQLVGQREPLVEVVRT